MNNKQIINFKIDEKRIVISTSESVKHVQFPFEVKEVENFGDLLVVRLKIPVGTVYNENIFGVSYDGKILWQIEKISHMDKDSPFMGMGQDENGFSAYNWDGFDYKINVKTGKILSKQYVK